MKYLLALLLPLSVLAEPCSEGLEEYWYREGQNRAKRAIISQLEHDIYFNESFVEKSKEDESLEIHHLISMGMLSIYKQSKYIFDKEFNSKN